jgi:hypothetical protein
MFSAMLSDNAADIFVLLLLVYVFIGSHKILFCSIFSHSEYMFLLRVIVIGLRVMLLSLA